MRDRLQQNKLVIGYLTSLQIIHSCGAEHRGVAFHSRAVERGMRGVNGEKFYNETKCKEVVESYEISNNLSLIGALLRDV